MLDPRFIRGRLLLISERGQCPCPGRVSHWVHLQSEGGQADA